MQREAQEYVKKCDQCQRFAPSIHQLGGILNLLSSPWPIAQWGLDIVGPFPKAVGNKWVEYRNTDQGGCPSRIGQIPIKQVPGQLR